MPSEFPMNDPQNIWQNQPTEAFKMSADQLRDKAQKRRKEVPFLSALLDRHHRLILFVFFARAMRHGPTSRFHAVGSAR